MLSVTYKRSALISDQNIWKNTFQYTQYYSTFFTWVTLLLLEMYEVMRLWPDSSLVDSTLSDDHFTDRWEKWLLRFMIWMKARVEAEHALLCGTIDWNAATPGGGVGWPRRDEGYTGTPSHILLYFFLSCVDRTTCYWFHASTPTARKLQTEPVFTTRHENSDKLKVLLYLLFR